MRNRIEALTGVRFLAAIWVVAYHYRSVVVFPPILKQVVDQGRAGVGLFFVLSGFILYHTYRGWFASGVSRRQYWSFARARFARVFPMSVVGLLLMTPVTLAAIKLAPNALPDGVTPNMLGLSWLLNLGLVHIYWPSPAIQYPWDVPTWSLADEVFFYALLPFLIAPILRFAASLRRLFGLAALFYGLELLAYCAFVVLLQRDASANQYVAADLWGYRLPIFRTWEFLLGVVAAIAVERGLKVPRWSLVLALGLAVIPTPADGPWWTFRWFALFTPLWALGIAWLATDSGLLTRLFSARLSVLLGEASYALYLTHWTTVHLLLLINRTSTADSVISLLVTIGVSILLFKYVETPCRKWLRGRVTSAAVQAAPLAAADASSTAARAAVAV